MYMYGCYFWIKMNELNAFWSVRHNCTSHFFQTVHHFSNFFPVAFSLPASAFFQSGCYFKKHVSAAAACTTDTNASRHMWVGHITHVLSFCLWGHQFASKFQGPFCFSRHLEASIVESSRETSHIDLCQCVCHGVLVYIRIALDAYMRSGYVYTLICLCVYNWMRICTCFLSRNGGRIHMHMLVVAYLN